MLYAATTTKYVFDYKPGEIYWCTADIGWITGHSYITYGPMLNGATSVIVSSRGNEHQKAAMVDINIVYAFNKSYKIVLLFHRLLFTCLGNICTYTYRSIFVLLITSNDILIISRQNMLGMPKAFNR